MTEEVMYYAIVDERSSVDEPAGVLRHFLLGDQQDESFGGDLEWRFSPLRYAAERGDTEYDLIPITEEKANQVVTRIRHLRHPGGE